MMNDRGIANLVNAIYAQAAKDYVVAVLKNDAFEIKSLENFLTSGAYFREADNKIGTYIMQQCRKEIEAANKFIDEFYISNAKEIDIDERKIVVNIVREIVRIRYFKKIRLLQRDQKTYFLIRVKSH